MASVLIETCCWFICVRVHMKITMYGGVGGVVVGGELPIDILFPILCFFYVEEG